MKFSKLVTSFITSNLDKMTDRELQKTLNEADELSTGNCNWLEYEVKNAIIKAAEMKQRQRLKVIATTKSYCLITTFILSNQPPK